MRGEAEVLAHAVDHHVDAAGTLEAADVDGNARVLRVLGGGRAGHRAQHVAGVELAERLDVRPGSGADRRRRVIDRVLLRLFLGRQRVLLDRRVSLQALEDILRNPNTTSTIATESRRGEVRALAQEYLAIANKRTNLRVMGLGNGKW